MSGFQLRGLGSDEEQAMMDACAGGDLAWAQRLVASQPSLATCKDSGGVQPLHVACEHGHLEMAQWLVTQPGVAADAGDNEECQPLHMACEHGHLEMAQWLVTLPGVAADAKTDFRWQPLHMACNSGHLAVAQWLVTQPGVAADAKALFRWRPLHMACNSGHLAVAQWLVTLPGVATDVKDDQGFQPLHMACNSGHLAVAQWLVSRGAELDARTKTGRTPLQVARAKVHTAVVDFLESILGAAGNPAQPAAPSAAPPKRAQPNNAPAMPPPAKRARTGHGSVPAATGLPSPRTPARRGDGNELGTPQLPVLSGEHVCLQSQDAGIPYVPFPGEWAPFTACPDAQEGTFRWWQQHQLVQVPDSCDEFGRVRAELQRDMPNAQLLKLERVQHRRLWQQYWTKRRYVASKNGGNPNEQLAWHGTSARRPEDVLESEDGLDVRFAGSAFYGRGIYLSESPVYQTAGRYAHWQSAEGPMQLLLVKVALGAPQELGQRVDEQTKAMSLPDERGRVPGCGVIRYDSVRAGPHRPYMSGSGANESIIYVVYKTEQVFPAYVVTYNIPPDHE